MIIFYTPLIVVTVGIIVSCFFKNSVKIKLVISQIAIFGRKKVLEKNLIMFLKVIL